MATDFPFDSDRQPFGTGDVSPAEVLNVFARPLLAKCGMEQAKATLLAMTRQWPAFEELPEALVRQLVDSAIERASEQRRQRLERN
jgi:hypothetical protein